MALDRNARGRGCYLARAIPSTTLSLVTGYLFVGNRRAAKCGIDVRDETFRFSFDSAGF